MIEYKFIEESIDNVRNYGRFPLKFEELNSIKKSVSGYINYIKKDTLFYEQSKCYFLIGLINLIVKEDEIALEDIKKAITLLGNSNLEDEEYEAVLKGYLSIIYFQQGDIIEFEKSFKEAEEKFKVLDAYEELLNLYLMIVELLSRREEFYDDINKYLEKIHKIVSDNKIDNLDFCYYILGKINILVFNNIVGAIFYFTQALDFAVKHNSIQLESRIRRELGECYRIEGNEEEKIKVLIALIMDDKYNGLDIVYKYCIVENIIEAFLATDKLENANRLIEYMEENYITNESLEKDHCNFLLIECKIRYLMNIRDEEQDIKLLYSEMKKVYHRIKDKCFFSNLDYHMTNLEGDIYFYLGEYEKSFEIHNRLLKYSIDNGNKRLVIEYYGKVSADYEKLGDIKNASKFLKNNIKMKKEWYENQSDLYTQILLREYDINNKNKEISKLMSMKERLTDIRNMDGVTGIFNRRFLEEIIDGTTSGEETLKDVSILMIDVDYFKKYNDNYGHLKGDEVLKSIGDILKSVCNTEEKIAIRYGGEEFLAILYNKDYKESIEIAEEIINKVRETNMEHKYSDIANIITVSIGIATAKVFHSYIELIKEADEALYIAKNNGKNKYIHLKDSC